MSEEEFEVRVLERDDGDTIIELTGTVNRGAKESLEAAYEATEGSRVLLDFSNVDYINSTGIAVIVGVLAMARAEERVVGAYGLSDHYREVFQITRLADFMTIYDDETAAVSAGA